jgi:hypothetical protein
VIITRNRRKTYDANFNPSNEDLEIMTDKSYYRVLDLRWWLKRCISTPGHMTAYFHKSIGGYHPAKLSIYQDLIEKQLYKFPNCQPVLDMLNTKYIINSDGRNSAVIPNPSANGPVWFVKGIKWVNTPAEEMSALDSLNTKDTAVIDKVKFSSFTNQIFAFDSSAKISLEKNDNDLMVYKSVSATPQFAVFSEVYYDKGWNAYIDGKKSEYAKANYVLRAMPVPAGEHTLEFRFEPQSHKIGSTVTLICSVLMLILLGFGFYRVYKRKEVFIEEA